jgi:hypothetical protein
MTQLLMAQTSVPRVAVVNESTLLDSAVSYNFTKSLQLQVRSDFAPIWGIDATVVATPPSEVAAYNWVLGIFDNSDQATALGYHDLTPQGKPVMKVFVKDSNDAGVPVSSVASHELLETLADAFIEALDLEDNGDGTGILFAQEVCDPVQADLYTVLGNSMSNFVTPWWFGDPLPAGLHFDFLQKLTAPFSLSAGGYLSFRNITKTGLQPWQQQFADERARTLASLSRSYRWLHKLGSTGKVSKQMSTRAFRD